MGILYGLQCDTALHGTCSTCVQAEKLSETKIPMIFRHGICSWIGDQCDSHTDNVDEEEVYLSLVHEKPECTETSGA